ncbi:hypothetical protein BASA62_002417 [Batrachochytrium salamandrivorans]|nr:hypothetical protein BASA62_002417 [Batrachochytrium salamandrivorans]
MAGVTSYVDIHSGQISTCATKSNSSVKPDFAAIALPKGMHAGSHLDRTRHPFHQTHAAREAAQTRPQGTLISKTQAHAVSEPSLARFRIESIHASKLASIGGSAPTPSWLLQNTSSNRHVKAANRSLTTLRAANTIIDKAPTGRWKSGQCIRTGLEIATTISDASKISYPPAPASARPKLPHINSLEKKARRDILQHNPTANTSIELMSLPSHVLACRSSHLSSSDTLDKSVWSSEDPNLGLHSVKFLPPKMTTKSPIAVTHLPADSCLKSILPSSNHLETLKSQAYPLKTYTYCTNIDQNKTHLPIVEHKAPKHSPQHLPPAATLLTIPKQEANATIPNIAKNNTVDDMIFISSKHLTTTECVSIVLGFPDTEIQIRRQIPIEIIYQSATLRHIHANSSGFLENLHGIVLPTFSASVMEEVMYYLAFSFTMKRKKAQGGTLSSTLPTSRVPEFVPRLETIFELIEAALYLDLPELIDLCAVRVARNFSGVESFGDLSTPLVRAILKHLSIGEMIICENDMLHIPKRLNNESTPSTDTSTESIKPNINATTIWTDRFWKLLAKVSQEFHHCNTSSYHSHQQETKLDDFLLTDIPDQDAHTISYLSNNDGLQMDIISELGLSVKDICRTGEFVKCAKQICLEFYISQAIAHFGKLECDVPVQRVLKLQGGSLRHLRLNLRLQCDTVYPCGFWNQLISNCPNLSRLSLATSGYSQCLCDVLESAGVVLSDACIVEVEIGVTGVSPEYISQMTPLCVCLDFIKDPLENECLRNDGSSRLLHGGPTSRSIRMETENTLELQGVSSLAEYLQDLRLPSHTSTIPISAIPSSLNTPRKLNTYFKWVPENNAVPYSTQPTEFQNFISQVQSVWIRIVRLDLSNISLGVASSTSIAELITHPMSILEHLSIANTNLTCLGIITIVNKLAQKTVSTHLAHLNLSQNMHSTDPHITSCCKTIAAYLEKTPATLHELCLSNNPLTSLGLIALTESLLCNTTLSTLEMDGVNLGSHVKHLVKSFTHRNSTMRSVSIARNGILPRGIGLLVQACKDDAKDHHLSSLAFTPPASQISNPVAIKGDCFSTSHICSKVQTFGPNACVQIITASEHAHQLVYLDLSAQCLDDTACTAIARLVQTRRNTCIRDWILADNLVTDDGLEALRFGLDARVRVDRGRSVGTGVCDSATRSVCIDLQRNWISSSVAHAIPAQLMRNGAGFVVLGYQHSPIKKAV